MKHAWYLFALWLMVACGEQTTDKEKETKEPAGNNNISFKPGYYTGIIPCADCEGISRQVLFIPDHRFRLMDSYQGRQSAPFISNGQWTIQDGQLQLLSGDSIISRYQVTDTGIVQLTMAGDPVPEEQSARYVLTSKDLAAGNVAWMKKKAAGIDFLVLGTEPFWSLEIDENKQVSFRQADRDTLLKVPYVKPAMLNGQWVYNLRTEATTMQILITPGYCSDGMSDNWYAYSVEVTYNGKMYSGCGVALNEALFEQAG